jgi:hypothetical protein
MYAHLTYSSVRTHQSALRQTSSVGLEKTFQIKGVQMYTNGLSNLFVVIALVVMVALTVREVSATSSFIADAASQDSECASLPSRHSIDTVYDADTGLWTTYSEHGPTGTDGGVIHLMSAYRSCSE